MSAPSEVHLVGSIGLDSVEEVFKVAGRTLGRRLKRVPDGEQGPRRLWISFQYPFLLASPFLKPDPGGAHRKNSGFRLLVLADGVRPADLRFGELGYAREARASYQDFLAARANREVTRAWPADNPRNESVAQIFTDMKAGVTAPEKITWIEDRRRAISLALDVAKPGDCLLIAGKGHEVYQEFADTVSPFDDRQVVRELIGIKVLKT